MFRQTISVPHAVASQPDSTGVSTDDATRRVILDAQARKNQGWYRIKTASARPLERLAIEALELADKPAAAFEDMMPGSRFASYIFVGSSVASLALHVEPRAPGDTVSTTLRSISGFEFVWARSNPTFSDMLSLVGRARSSDCSSGRHSRFWRFAIFVVRSNSSAKTSSTDGGSNGVKASRSITCWRRRMPEAPSAR